MSDSQPEETSEHLGRAKTVAHKTSGSKEKLQRNCLVDGHNLRVHLFAIFRAPFFSLVYIYKDPTKLSHLMKLYFKIEN